MSSNIRRVALSAAIDANLVISTIIACIEGNSLPLKYVMAVAYPALFALALSEGVKAGWPSVEVAATTPAVATETPEAKPEQASPETPVAVLVADKPASPAPAAASSPWRAFFAAVGAYLLAGCLQMWQYVATYTEKRVDNDTDWRWYLSIAITLVVMIILGITQANMACSPSLRLRYVLRPVGRSIMAMILAMLIGWGISDAVHGECSSDTLPTYH